MNKRMIYSIIYAGVIFTMLATGCSGAAASPTPRLLPTLAPTLTPTPRPPTATSIPPIVTVSPADPMMAPGVIAFISDRDGNREIYSIKPDGSQETRLTDDKRFNNGEPVWSPDSKSIAFVRLPPNKEYGEAGDIWVMRADGGPAMQISPEGCRAPATLVPGQPEDRLYLKHVVPDDRSSAGEQTYGDAYDVYISNADGTDLNRPKGYLTAVWSAMGDLGMITNRNWSPNGQALAYVDCDEDSCSILGISPQGGGFDSRLSSH